MPWRFAGRCASARYQYWPKVLPRAPSAKGVAYGGSLNSAPETRRAGIARSCVHKPRQAGICGGPHRGRNGLQATGAGAMYCAGWQTGAAAGLHLVILRGGGPGAAYGIGGAYAA